MAGNLLPLLLLGGGAALILTSKKKGSSGANGSGFRLVGDCEGLEITSPTAMSYTQKWFEANAGNTAESTEEDLARFFESIFPQCQWPPAEPDSFMISGISYGARQRGLIELLGGRDPGLDAASGGSVGGVIGGTGRSFSGALIFPFHSRSTNFAPRQRSFNGVGGLASRPGSRTGIEEIVVTSRSPSASTGRRRRNARRASRGYVAPAWKRGGRLAAKRRRRRRIPLDHPAAKDAIAARPSSGDGPSSGDPKQLYAWNCGLCADGSPMICVDWDDGTTTGGC